jgi:peroxiredoxin
MAPGAGSRWVAVAFVGAGLLFGLAAGAVIFLGLPAARPAGLGGQPAADGGPTVPAAPAPVVGAPAPNFTLRGLDGADVTLADLRGQVVLLNFWATWCGPCEAEMPAIQDRYETFKDSGLTVLAVNLAEPEADVRAFVERLGLTFTILLDPSETVFDLYRVRGYPTTFLVDRAGTISHQRVGYMSDGQLDQYLFDSGFSSQ